MMLNSKEKLFSNLHKTTTPLAANMVHWVKSRNQSTNTTETLSGKQQLENYKKMLKPALACTAGLGLLILYMAWKTCKKYWKTFQVTMRNRKLNDATLQLEEGVLLENNSSTKVTNQEENDRNNSARTSNVAADDVETVGGEEETCAVNLDKAVDNEDQTPCEIRDGELVLSEEEEIETKSIVSIINSDLNIVNSHEENNFFSHTSHDKNEDNKGYVKQIIKKYDISLGYIFGIKNFYARISKNISLSGDRNEQEVMKSKIEAKCKKRNP